MVRYVRSRLGKIKVWYDLSMVHYLRQVTEFALPARIANALIRFLLTTPVHAARIGHTLVTPINILIKSWILCGSNLVCTCI